MTTGKTIALTRLTFVGKVISLLLNMLSRLVITFLPSSKYLFISWLQSPSAVILEPPKIKSDTVSTVSPSTQGVANSAYILRPKVIVGIWPQYTGNGLKLRDRALGEAKRNSFMALSGKGGHSGLMPLRLCVPPQNV